MPVAFVWPPQPTAEPSPSDAVVVVREFLRREIAAGGKDALTLQVLGPSPVHADFVLEEGMPTQDSALAVATIRKPGYANIVIRWNPEMLNADTAQSTVMKLCSREVGFYMKSPNASVSAPAAGVSSLRR